MVQKPQDCGQEIILLTLIELQSVCEAFYGFKLPCGPEVLGFINLFYHLYPDHKMSKLI